MDLPTLIAAIEPLIPPDPSFDGKVFDIALSDVPEHKPDLVRDEYELDAPKHKTTVAVKIVDMLGEEVLITDRV